MNKFSPALKTLNDSALTMRTANALLTELELREVMDRDGFVWTSDKYGYWSATKRGANWDLYDVAFEFGPLELMP